MRKLILLFIFSFIGQLYAQTLSFKNLEIDLNVIDHIANPKVVLIVKNTSNINIKIPEIVVRSNYMAYNYFEFASDFPEYSDEYAKYKGELHIFTSEELKKTITLKKGKTIKIEYVITDFYDLPEKMYSVQKVRYVGPLGITDNRLIYFETNKNTNDFFINMKILQREGLLIAELEYNYISNEIKYYPKSYFTRTENIANQYFSIEINNTNILYKGLKGDSFNLKSLIQDLRLCHPGDRIITEVILNRFYDIPTIIDTFDITYKGELGNANEKY